MNFKLKESICHQFLINNGWHKEDEIDEYAVYLKKDNIQIDVSEDEIVLISDTGDFAHIEVSGQAIYTLIGYLITQRLISCNFKWN